LFARDPGCGAQIDDGVPVPMVAGTCRVPGAARVVLEHLYAPRCAPRRAPVEQRQDWVGGSCASRTRGDVAPALRESRGGRRRTAAHARRAPSRACVAHPLMAGPQLRSSVLRAQRACRRDATMAEWWMSPANAGRASRSAPGSWVSSPTRSRRAPPHCRRAR
jgi:hypothetical protein